MEQKNDSKNTPIDQKLSSYIENFHKKPLKNLKVLEGTFKIDHSHLQIPFSEGAFLKTFLKSLSAKKVLEIGTFRGFSSVFLAEALPKDGLLTTIDFDERNYALAETLWKKTGVSKKIKFLKGKALPLLSVLIKEKEIFDVVFIDADKQNMKEYFLKSLKLLRPGGVVLVDNALWAGKVVRENLKRESVFYTKEFNEFVFKKYKDVCLIPAWDGVILVVKN